MKQKVDMLLVKLSKITKTDMRYLASGGFWLTVGQSVSSLSALFLAVAFANLVSPELYGTYKYVLSMAALLAIFTLPGLGPAVSRAVAQGHDDVLTRATPLRIKCALLGTLTALFIASYYFINQNIQLAISFLIIGSTLPFFDTFTLYMSYFTGKRRFDLQSIYHFIAQTVSVVSLITAIVLTKNIFIILLAYFIPLIIIRYRLYIRTKNNITNISNDSAAIREAIDYGKHLTFINILSTVASQIDKILLWKFLGPAQVAIYTFAVAIPEQLKGPLKGVADLALPKFANQSQKTIYTNLPALRKKIFLYALILGAISILYILIAPYIFKILFPQYLDSILYSQIFMVSAIGLVGTIPLSAISAHKKIKEQYIFFTTQPILQIILYVIFVPLLVIMGAILARVIMRVLYVIQSMFLLESAFKQEQDSNTTKIR